MPATHAPPTPLDLQTRPFTGAVYFIISAMATIFVNLGEREEGEWSAYRCDNGDSETRGRATITRDFSKHIHLFVQKR